MSTTEEITDIVAPARRRWPLFMGIVVVLAAITTGIVVATGGSKASAEVLVQTPPLRQPRPTR